MNQPSLYYNYDLPTNKWRLDDDDLKLRLFLHNRP